VIIIKDARDGVKRDGGEHTNFNQPCEWESNEMQIEINRGRVSGQIFRMQS
jgi:hypothetical protein